METREPKHVRRQRHQSPEPLGALAGEGQAGISGALQMFGFPCASNPGRGREAKRAPRTDGRTEGSEAAESLSFHPCPSLGPLGLPREAVRKTH